MADNLRSFSDRKHANTCMWPEGVGLCSCGLVNESQALPDEWDKRIAELEAKLAAAVERERVLREALEPLANCFTDYDGLQDDWDSQRRLTVGDFRRADAALAQPAERPKVWRPNAFVTCPSCGKEVPNWKPHVCSAAIKESFNDY